MNFGGLQILPSRPSNIIKDGYRESIYLFRLNLNLFANFAHEEFPVKELGYFLF
jgi:hypothetical protein